MIYTDDGELDQDRHGLCQRPRVRGVQGAQQHRRRALARRRSTPSFPSTFYVRFTSDGTTVQAQRSADGVDLDEHGQRHQPQRPDEPEDRHVRDRVHRRGRRQANTARFDYFTLDAPQEPSDEFEGTSLNLCRWSQIVRHEPGGYTVGGGNLTLPAAHGDFFANGAEQQPEHPAPAGARRSVDDDHAGSRSTRTRTTSRPGCWSTATTPTTSRPTTSTRTAAGWSSCARPTTSQPASAAP